MRLDFAALDFALPAAVTRGRDSVVVEIDAGASPTPWTAFGYQVSSHLAPGN